MTPQNGKSRDQDSFETRPGIKSHSDVGAAERRREYYMGEGGGFPQVRAVVSLVNPKSPVVCPSTKVLQNAN